MAARKIDVNRQEVQKEVVDNLIISAIWTKFVFSCDVEFKREIIYFTELEVRISNSYLFLVSKTKTKHEFVCEFWIFIFVFVCVNTFIQWKERII